MAGKELKKTYTFKFKPSVRKKLADKAVKAHRSSSEHLEYLIEKDK